MQGKISLWFRRILGTPWAALLPILLVLPFLLSGAVRFQTGWSLAAGLVCWLVVAAVAIIAVRRFGAPRLTEQVEGSWIAAGTAVTALLLVVATYRLWWTPVFGGMPNTVVGVDVGNHIKIFNNFLTGDHKQYEGFVGLYALMYWYRQLLSLEGFGNTSATYYALRFAHYATLLAIPVALALVVYPSLAQLKTRGTQVSALALALPVQLLVLATLVFPVVQYYQAEGFYSQTVGLYPLVLGWVFFGLVEDVRARLVLMLFWLLVQRYCYGLNLGDTLITCGYLTFWEARALRPAWLRWGARLFTPVAFAVAYVIYNKLYPLRGMSGYFNNQLLHWVTAVQLALSLMLLAADSVLVASGIAVSGASARLWRYAGTFGLVNSCLIGTYLSYDQPVMYYILKFGMYAYVLVALCIAGPVSTLIAHMVERANQWASWHAQARLITSVFIALVIVLFAYSYGYANYRPLALERYERTVPNAVLLSHFEPAVDDFIERELKERGARFGGYYDFYWPRTFLTNALRKQFVERPDYHYNGMYNAGAQMFEPQPGECYFLVGKLEHYHTAPEGSAMRAQLNSFWARPKKCTRWAPEWTDDRVDMCVTCF